MLGCGYNGATAWAAHSGMVTIFRRLILFLMFFLAGTSNCFCVSYDVDPNDDIPPVTLEFNFVVPGSSAIHTVSVTVARATIPPLIFNSFRTNAGPVATHSQHVACEYDANSSRCHLSLRC